MDGEVSFLFRSSLTSVVLWEAVRRTPLGVFQGVSCCGGESTFSSRARSTA
jgi:hypothetical protein